MKKIFFLSIALISLSVHADMFVSATGKKSVNKDLINSPFGQFGHGGHIHSGWDLQNHDYNVAVVSGTVKYRGGKTNAIELIPDDTSKIAKIVYRHSCNYRINLGHVNAGDVISKACDAGSPGATHTHLEVIVREGTMPSRVIISKDKSTLGQAALSLSRFKGQGITPYSVEPYPFFGGETPFSSIAKGAFGRFKNSKDMYEKLYGSGGLVTTGNIEGSAKSNIAHDMGIENPSDEQIAQFLFEQGGNIYGGEVSHFDDDENLSLEERLWNIANFRFSSEDWAKSLTSASNRALYADYVAAEGLELYLKREMQKRTQHIEALYATLAAQKIKQLRDQSKYAFVNASKTNITNSIQ